MTTLLEAVDQGDLALVKRTLTKSNINSRDGLGWTSLHWTAFNDTPAIAEYLLDHGADVNAKGGDDETPLHVAASQNKYAIAKILLAYGANPNQQCLNKNLTPIDYATSKNDEEMIALLNNPPPRKQSVSAAPSRPIGAGFFAFFRNLFRPEVELIRGKFTATDMSENLGSVTADGDINDLTLNIMLENGNEATFRISKTVPRLVQLALQSDKAGCRRIGESLNSVGGFALMVAVGTVVQEVSNDARMFIERIAWPNIGRWQG